MLWNLDGLEHVSISNSFFGADERSRTSDLLITNQLLYQLSYISTQEGELYRNGRVSSGIKHDIPW